MAEPERWTQHGTLGQWRDKILRRDTEALCDALDTWREGAMAILKCWESGQAFRVHPMVKNMTHLLCWVCDAGDTIIDPTPLLRLLRIFTRSAGDDGKLNTYERKEWLDAFDDSIDVHNRLLMLWIAREGGEPPNMDEEAADGPWGFNQWRHDGKEVSGRLTTKPWQLAAHLHKRLGERVEFNDPSVDKIFDAPIQPATIQRHCSTIKNWFEDKGVPLTVKSDKFGMVMEKTTLEK